MAHQLNDCPPRPRATVRRALYPVAVAAGVLALAGCHKQNVRPDVRLGGAMPAPHDPGDDVATSDPATTDGQPQPDAWPNATREPDATPQRPGKNRPATLADELERNPPPAGGMPPPHATPPPPPQPPAPNPAGGRAAPFEPEKTGGDPTPSY